MTLLLATISTLVLADKRAEIDGHLTREANELALLAERAVDPATGVAFDSAGGLLQLYISRTIPDPNETMFVLVNDVVIAKTSDVPPVRLDLDPAFLSIISNTQSATLGDYPTEVGNARYVVVPVAGQPDSGALVAVIFSDLDQASITQLLIRFALIGFFALVAVGIVGWFVAGRILSPVQRLSAAVQQVSADELGNRIEIQSGSGELKTLAQQFNRMLDRLEEAFASQRRFVDDAGHELRTPLTIIRGHFDLMQKDPQSAAQSAAIISDELERMSRLVTDLQQLTKSNQPDFIKPEEFEAEQLADEVLVKASALGDRKFRVESTQARVIADRHRLTQAVLQLVENAVKHTKPGDEIEIEIFESGKSLFISVSDSGSGIDPSELDRIFEPFVRGRGDQSLQGSGLGLALVSAIARGHGGSVEAGASKLGGAKLTIEIPKGL